MTKRIPGERVHKNTTHSSPNKYNTMLFISAALLKIVNLQIFFKDDKHMFTLMFMAFLGTTQAGR